MARFRRILVHVAPDIRNDHALYHASRLADACRADLTVVSVIEEPGRSLPIAGGLALAIDEAIREQRRACIQDLAERARLPVPFGVEVLTGQMLVELIRAVLAGSYDLLIKAADSEGGSRLLGSTDVRLLRKCPAAVCIVRPSGPLRLARIAAAIDPATGIGEERALNTRIVDHAAFLAGLYDAECHVVHAWSAYAEKLARGTGRMPPAELQKYVGQHRIEARKATWKLLAPFRSAIHPSAIHLLKGEPGRVVPRLVRRIGADLLVLGTIGRTGIAGLLMGSTAETIVSEVNCSVMALKPESFISPVRLAS